MTFDHLVVIGDSWTWGADLSEYNRANFSWPVRLSQYLNLPLINLGVQSATNYNYKWLLTEYLQKNQGRALIILGITSPTRLLFYDNQQKHFQPWPEYFLKDDTAFIRKNLGGYTGIQLSNPWHGKIENNLPMIAKNYITYQLDSDYVNLEIDSLWEILFVHYLIGAHAGTTIYWSNLHSYQLHKNAFFAPHFDKMTLINDLEPIINLENVRAHPNVDQHHEIFLKIKDQIC